VLGVSILNLSTIFLLDLTVQTVWYLFVCHFTKTWIFYNTTPSANNVNRSQVDTITMHVSSLYWLGIGTLETSGGSGPLTTIICLLTSAIGIDLVHFYFLTFKMKR
jgi:hypothetical protein